VDTTQIVFGVALIVVLVGIAGYFAWRQWRTLRSLRGEHNLSPEDFTYTRRQAWRRLLGSLLMVLLAVLLGISFLLEGPANELVRQGEANQAQGVTRQLSPEQAHFFNVYRTFWLIFLLLLLAMIVLAAIDYFAIRRYGQRHYRQIQEDRRAMIEGELTRLRSRRNGHS
jgi:hypothetical protein